MRRAKVFAFKENLAKFFLLWITFSVLVITVTAWHNLDPEKVCENVDYNFFVSVKVLGPDGDIENKNVRLDCRDSDNWCENERFEDLCPVTCLSCVKDFYKIAELPGHYKNAFMGMRMAVAKDGMKVFAPEIDRAKGKLTVREFDGQTKTTSTRGVYAQFKGRIIQLSTSSDRNHLIISYKYYKPFKAKDGTVRTFKLNPSGAPNDMWTETGFWKASEFDDEPNFGHAVSISDDGKNVMIASERKVRVYYHIEDDEWKSRRDIPWDKNRRIEFASMTPDAKMVAISQRKPSNVVRIYKWKTHHHHSHSSDSHSSDFHHHSNSHKSHDHNHHSYKHKHSHKKWNGQNRWVRNGEAQFNSGELAKHPMGPIQLSKDGDLLFVGVPGAFEKKGSICVFERKVNKDDDDDNYGEKTWVITRETGDRCIIQGKKNNDRMGREFSVSRNADFLAWASETEAGYLKWDGDNWSEGNALIKAKKPNVALSPGGEHLAVGLPFEENDDGPLKKKQAGMVLLFEWNYPENDDD